MTDSYIYIELFYSNIWWIYAIWPNCALHFNDFSFVYYTDYGHPMKAQIKKMKIWADMADKISFGRT